MNVSKETIPNHLNWLLPVVEFLIALGIAVLCGYAAYSFMAKFGE